MNDDEFIEGVKRKGVEPWREKILRLPEMFIGHKQWDSDALHALIGKVLRDSAEPQTLNECTALNITIEKTGTMCIEDNGRGLPTTPVPMYKDSETSAFVHVLTWYMKTGEPYNRYYHEHYGFLSYVGGVLSFLSEYLKVTTIWDGDLYTISLSRGEITEPLRKIGSTNERGTRIEFVPDSDVFPDLALDSNKLMACLSELSAKYPPVQFRFEDKNTDAIVEF